MNSNSTITYNIGWIASGTYAFQDAAFRMSLTGDTANAFKDSLGNTINQGMTGTLTGLHGSQTTHTDQYLGIQPVTNPSQSLAWGDNSSGNYEILLDKGVLDFRFSTYDLKSAVGPISLPGYDLFLRNYLNSYSFTGGRDFTFEAAPLVPTPVPPSVLLLGSWLVGLVGWRRFRKS